MPKPHNSIADIVDSESTLIHRVDSTYPLLVDNRLNTEKLIKVERIPGLSHNRVPPSEISDVFILLRKKIHKNEWWPGLETPKVRFWDYTLMKRKERSHFFVKAGDFDFEDSYRNPYDAPNPEFTFRVRFVHKPTITNYSHYELEVSNHEGVLINFKSKWKKLIGFSIREQFENKAFFEITHEN